MRRRRSRSAYFTGEREYRPTPAYLRRGEPIFQGSSDYSDELDRLVAAPALASIHRFPDFESDPVRRSPWAESTAWVEYPPERPRIAQEPRKAPPRSSPKGYSLASLLRPFFRNPELAQVCVRRKERREVIFARTGGGRGMPPRVRTEDSNYSCGPR